MNLPLLIETVRHLRPTQIAHQLMHRLWKPKLREEVPPAMSHIAVMLTQPIAKPRCYDGEGRAEQPFPTVHRRARFTFLNIASTFRDWNMDDDGPLWTYKLNYMDWLEQEGISEEDCLKWIDRFIDELPGNHAGLDPYPIALRIINWAKFFSKHPDCLNQRRSQSLYAQTLLLSRKLEYHLLGNHLLEDAYALFIASVFFNDCHLYQRATRLLEGQLREQILPDGAHYEQSPMYHCIMLDRLLDCINFSSSNLQFKGQDRFTAMLKQKASLMLGHLQNIIYNDGTIPLLNDSAYGIAPDAEHLFVYARRLNISWKPIPLKECGYRKLADGHIEVIADIGDMAASCQPGHSHADTFNYELRIDGRPVIVDTGISTYNKNERRQYERSTAAHNTVTVGGKDSSQVWGGFRVGRRARVTVVKDEANDILARHDGFGRQAVHERRFSCKDGAFMVEDSILGKDIEAVSYLHLAPGLHAEIVSATDGLVKVGDISIQVEHCLRMELQNDDVSVEYNRLQSCDVLALHFIRHLQYTLTQPHPVLEG